MNAVIGETVTKKINTAGLAGMRPVMMEGEPAVKKTAFHIVVIKMAVAILVHGMSARIRGTDASRWGSLTAPKYYTATAKIAVPARIARARG